MTKQDEQTKHLKDASHILSPYEAVAHALSCAVTNNLVKQIIWKDLRGKILIYKRVLEL